ncbi:MAG: TrmH family RNA methyltransferase [Bacilli bacterium]|nr:TrmH family RNA methyltransferase [Bacilli bacterium]MDD4644059.1 TrmH family RNA methyltransferase [Bacilli bacterium]
MKKYTKGNDVSYTLGVFPTIELIKNKPNLIEKIIFSTKLDISENVRNEILDFCHKHSVKYEIDDKIINKLSDKDNCYVIGVYRIEKMSLDKNEPHIVLVNPSNMGNLGTIIRTVLGFDFKNIAIINPAVDINNPKVVRASMGALFNINYKYYDSFEQYKSEYPNHPIYTFMLNGDNEIKDIEINGGIYSLVFGNEASGLSADYMDEGKSIVIEHTKNIDSLNLTVAVGVATYEFFNKMRNK